MSDITTVLYNDPANGFRGDWAWDTDDLLDGDDLASAVLNCIFSDGLADPSWSLSNPRGWWADAYRPDTLGSGLYYFARAKKSAATLYGVQQTITDSLAPLINAGAVASVDVSANWRNVTRLQVRIRLTKPDGTNLQYDWAWPL